MLLGFLAPAELLLWRLRLRLRPALRLGLRVVLEPEHTHKPERLLQLVLERSAQLVLGHVLRFGLRLRLLVSVFSQ